MSKQTASVYRRKDRIVIHAQAQTPDGIWILDGVPEVHAADAADHRLGSSMLRILRQCRHGVIDPNPRGMYPAITPLLKAAGVRSWRTLVYGALLVHVQHGDDVHAVSLIPTLNKGAREGFVELTDKRLVVRAATDENLGAALKQAFSRCE